MSEPTDPSPRLGAIFPPGFDSSLKSSSSCSHLSYTPINLYKTLTEDYKSYVRSTHVTTIWYGKQKKRARHEFILIEVEDSGLKNYIVLDRNNANHPSEGGQSHNSHRGIFGCQSLAVDAFRVSYDGNDGRLLQECHLLKHRYLERIDFSHSEPLFLYQLVTLVKIVSETSPKYAVLGKNCYWFAGIIWECVHALCPKAQHDKGRAPMRGRFAGLRYTPDRAEIARICHTYNSDIKAVDERLTELRRATVGKRWVMEVSVSRT